jgi:hypothetical protein
LGASSILPGVDANYPLGAQHEHVPLVLVHLRWQLVQRQRARRVAPDLHRLGTGDGAGDGTGRGTQEGTRLLESRRRSARSSCVRTTLYLSGSSSRKMVTPQVEFESWPRRNTSGRMGEREQVANGNVIQYSLTHQAGCDQHLLAFRNC